MLFITSKELHSYWKASVDSPTGMSLKNGNVCPRRSTKRKNQTTPRQPALVKKDLRVEYFWSSIVQDTEEFMKKSYQCQCHGDVHNASPSDLHALISPFFVISVRNDLRSKLQCCTYISHGLKILIACLLSLWFCLFFESPHRLRIIRVDF